LVPIGGNNRRLDGLASFRHHLSQRHQARVREKLAQGYFYT